MRSLVRYTLAATALSLVGGCVAKPPRYPNPPALTSTVQAYNPAVIPLAPQTYRVPVAPLPIPPGSMLAGSDLIGEQDLIEVNVFKVPELTRSVRVDARGTITFPLIGSVRAKGLKPAQLEQEIARRLGETYMNDPQVTVLVKESVQNRVTVEGAVNRPGMFPVVGSMSLLQALAQAGGLTAQADSRRAILLRRDARGQVSQQPVDIAAIRQGRLQDIPLLRDDRIVVQEGVYNRFTVTGAVGSPGVFPLQEGMTVLQAIASAGGMTRTADKRHAVIFRRGMDGQVRRYTVNLEAVYRGQSQDPMIQQDDRIVVLDSDKRLLFEDASRFIGPVSLF